MTILVSFKLPAEYTAHATGGFLLGEFNNWEPATGSELRRNEDGSLQTELQLAPGRTYQYKYLLNDGRWVNDANQTAWTDFSGAYVENSIIEVKPAEETTASRAEAKPPVKMRRQVKKTVIADDLTAIAGINKKIAAILKKSGIISYAQLAKTGIKKLKTILETNNIDLKKYDPLDWAKDARELVGKV